MRPLVHPALEDITVEGILHALADPMRVAIFASLVKSDCSKSCSKFLEINEQAIPKSTLSQHFRALREAGLIRSERKGVEMQNTSRCAELEKPFGGLIRAIVAAHSAQQAGKPRGRSASGKKSAKRSTKRS